MTEFMHLIVKTASGLDEDNEREHTAEREYRSKRTITLRQKD